MAKRLDGKVAVISGAAAGIGQASAVRLAEEGARIVIADREDAGKTLQLIKSAGGKAQAIRCDVSDPESRRPAAAGRAGRRPLRHPRQQCRHLSDANLR